MPLGRLVLAIALAAGLAASGACGPLAPAPPVALVSGRDDHGLLERPAIGLQRSPTDRDVVATAHDGDVALVLAREGLWTRIRLVASGEEGWIADHDLRGEAVRTDPRPRRVTFLAAERADGGVRVRVRYADDGTDEWVPGTSLTEVGAR